MTIKVPRVYSATPNGKTDGLTQSILQQTALLGDNVSDYIVDLMGRIERKQAALTGEMMRIREKSCSTQNMANMKRRFHNLLQFAKSVASLDGASVQSDVESLLAVMLPYEKEITNCRQHLTCESLVSSLIADLECDEMQQVLASISYGSMLFDNLKAAQEKFITAHASFHYLRHLQVEKGCATKMRKELIRLINTELVDYLNTMLRVESTEYLSYATAVQSLISAHNTVMRRRTRSSNKEAEE